MEIKCLSHHNLAVPLGLVKTSGHQFHIPCCIYRNCQQQQKPEL